MRELWRIVPSLPGDMASMTPELAAAYEEIDRLKSGFNEIQTALHAAEPLQAIVICKDVTEAMLTEEIIW